MNNILDLIKNGNIIYTDGKLNTIYKINIKNTPYVLKCSKKNCGPLFREAHAMLKIKNHTKNTIAKLVKCGVIDDLRYCIYPLYFSINVYEVKNCFPKFTNDIVDALDYIHNLTPSYGLTHGDIKLENIMKNKSNFLLIDFETSILFSITIKKEVLQKYKNIGSTLYNSLDSMKGYKCVPRSDLQNFGFVLASLFQTLPWQGLNSDDEIIKLKKNFKTNDDFINTFINSKLSYGERFVKNKYMNIIS